MYNTVSIRNTTELCTQKHTVVNFVIFTRNKTFFFKKKGCIVEILITRLYNLYIPELRGTCCLKVQDTLPGMGGIL